MLYRLISTSQANLKAPAEYNNRTSNPTSLVVGLLPSKIESFNALNASDVTINILDSAADGFAEIPGIYNELRSRAKKLHDQYGGKVDLIVHLGRGPWDHATVERRAFRQDMTCGWATKEAEKGYYVNLDNDDKSAHDLGPNPWMDVPMGLNTALDVDAVVSVANASLSKHGAGRSSSKVVQVLPHFEAGNLGCGFMYYESLAHCYANGRKRDVLFCHIPRGVEDEDLQRARDAIVSVIGSGIKWLIERDEGKYSEQDISARLKASES